MGNLFIQRLQHLTQDRVLDRREYSELKTYQNDLKTENDPSAFTGDHVLKSLSKYQARTQMTFNRKDPSPPIRFSFTPQYSEKDTIPGKTIEERTQYISQKDNLQRTDDESHRCASSSVLNAFLLSGGTLDQALQKLSMSEPAEMTYETIHMIQENLYDKSNMDNKNGLSLMVNYSYQPSTDKITKVNPTGEIVSAAQTLGMKVTGIMGTTRSQHHHKEEAVKSFFSQNPKGSILASVYMDTDTGAILPATASKPVNHAVIIYQRQGKHYLLDTGSSNNGAGNSRRLLSSTEVTGLVYQSGSSTIGLSQ